MLHQPTDELVRIAIADDHALFCDTLSKTINEWENCKVVLQAYSGTELLEKIPSKKPVHLVLTDLRMPGMSGYETIHRLKKHHPEIKVMVISMFGGKDCLMEVLKAGADGFIQKTEDLRILKTAIHDIMKHGYYSTDAIVARIFKKVMDTGDTSYIKGLSQEEICLLKLLCTDKTYKEIGAVLQITDRRAEYLTIQMMEKFGVNGRIALVLHATENGLLM